MSLPILPRSAWGAAPRRGPYTPWPAGGPRGLVVHWTGVPGHVTAPPEQVLRSIQQHDFARGYVDASYNLAVSPDGRLWEVRGLAVASAANGGGVNTTYASICYLAGVQDIFTDAARSTIRNVWAHIGGRLLAHREVNSTSCPGDNITLWVQQVRMGGTPPAPAPNLQPLLAAIRKVRATIGSGPVLRQGSKGQAVADWQFALVIGYPHEPAVGMPVDGVFGPRTVAATKAFQGSARITRDGVVGPVTRRAMKAVLDVRFANL